MLTEEFVLSLDKLMLAEKNNLVRLARFLKLEACGKGQKELAETVYKAISNSGQ